MGIAAIPTKYKGIQFRSRLEARWAAFFDLCQWHWKYEPFDLSGWIPDFAIFPYASDFSAGGLRLRPNLQRPILVEVKPIASICRETVEKIARAVPDWMDKNQSAEEVWLIGNGPMQGESRWFRQLGWRCAGLWMCPEFRCQDGMISDPKHWNPAVAVQIYGPGGILNGSILSDFITVNGNEDKDVLVDHPMCINLIMEGGQEVIDARWAEAGNVVQWKRPTAGASA